MLRLPVEALESRAFLVSVNFEAVNPIVHQSELDAVCSGDVPVEAGGSAHAVEVGVVVAEELVVRVGSRGLAPGCRTFWGVEDVAQFDIGKRFYRPESLPLDREAGFQLERIRHVLESVHIVCVVRELKFLAEGELPVSGVVLSGQVEGEAVAWFEGIRRIEVAYEDVFATDFEIVADLVFYSDRCLMPFDSRERIFRSEFITSTQMQSLSDFPIHFG